MAVEFSVRDGMSVEELGAKWLANLEVYKAFKAEQGREPLRRESYAGKNIGTWCCVQRNHYNAGTLSEARAAALRAAGLRLEMRPLVEERRWNEFYSLYCEYIEKYGRIPYTYEAYQDAPLGSWVNVQRQKYKHGSLPDAHYEKLCAVGFVFEPLEQEWQGFFEAYKAFKAENGRDPLRPESYGGYNIGVWCVTQRRAHKMGYMPESRCQQLLDAGFVFDRKQTEWDKHLKAYKAFKKKCKREPKLHETYRGASVGFWRLNQRTAYREGRLSDERKRALEKAGFSFADYRNDWMTMLDVYVAFKAEHGREPTRSECYDGLPIGRWCGTQRFNIKKGQMSDEYIQKLQSVGFIVSPRDHAWWENLDLCKAFVSEYGRVPRLDERYQGAPLGGWYWRQYARCQSGALAPDRVQAFMAISESLPQRAQPVESVTALIDNASIRSEVSNRGLEFNRDRDEPRLA